LHCPPRLRARRCRLDLIHHLPGPRPAPSRSRDAGGVLLFLVPSFVMFPLLPCFPFSEPFTSSQPQTAGCSVKRSDGVFPCSSLPFSDPSILILGRLVPCLRPLCCSLNFLFFAVYSLGTSCIPSGNEVSSSSAFRSMGLDEYFFVGSPARPL